MSTQPKTRYTLQEYLDLERSGQARHEYLDGEVFAMGGASWQHVVIVSNVVRRLGNQLEGRGFQVTSNDLRVKVSVTGLYTYPDVTIVCDKPQFEQPGDTLLNPTPSSRYCRTRPRPTIGARSSSTTARSIP